MSLKSIKQGYGLIQLINKEMGVNDEYIIQELKSINTEIIDIEKSPPNLNDLNIDIENIDKAIQDENRYKQMQMDRLR